MISNMSGEDTDTGAVLEVGRYITPERAAQMERINNAQIAELKRLSTATPTATEQKKNTGLWLTLAGIGAAVIALSSGIFSSK